MGHFECPDKKDEENGLAFLGKIGLVRVLGAKYTNKACVKFARMCYIFEKAMVQGPQKVFFDKNKVCDMQMHKYIYTNTAWVKFPDRPNMSYIFEMVMVRGPKCLTSTFIQSLAVF